MGTSRQLSRVRHPQCPLRCKSRLQVTIGIRSGNPRLVSRSTSCAAASTTKFSWRICSSSSLATTYHSAFWCGGAPFVGLGSIPCPRARDTADLSKYTIEMQTLELYLNEINNSNYAETTDLPRKSRMCHRCARGREISPRLPLFLRGTKDCISSQI